MGKNKKVVRYKKPMNLNIGIIIFAVIFVYLLFSIYSYISHDHVQFYEVAEGSIVNDRIYDGLILREEKVKNAPQSGYVSHYVREGKRAASGARVYSLDETGQLGRFLEEQQENNSMISPENLSDLKRQLSSFCIAYEDQDFEQVYDEKSALDASVAEFMNFDALETMEGALREKGIVYQQIYADEPGIVSYVVDSLEGLTAAAVTADHFDRTSYKKDVTRTGLVEGGTPVYKLITSENWEIVFPIEEEDRELLAGKQSLAVRPRGKDLLLKGPFSIVSGADGTVLGKLDLDRYMIQFVSDRFLEFEIVTDRTEGLKIPVTAVTEKDFFTVPVSYLAKGGDSDESMTGFYKETYSESGEASVVFTPVEIYHKTDELVYVNRSENGPLNAGDYVIRPDTNERYQMGASASLEGVYNINKGYAVFKQIEILSGNGEYYIIDRGSRYGLSVYDHIVLNADTVSEGQIVYQ